MPTQFLNPPGLSPTYGWTHVVTSTGGKTVYISGQVAVDERGQTVGKGDLTAQAEKTCSCTPPAPAPSPTAPRLRRRRPLLAHQLSEPSLGSAKRGRSDPPAVREPTALPPDLHGSGRLELLRVIPTRQAPQRGPAEARLRGRLALEQFVALPAHDQARLPGPRGGSTLRRPGGQMEALRPRDLLRRVLGPHWRDPIRGEQESPLLGKAVPCVALGHLPNQVQRRERRVRRGSGHQGTQEPFAFISSCLLRSSGQ
jgi:hypothetical protein